MYELQQLSTVVQRNCHISDARHARDYSMCTYLLKMREYYRWEKGYPFGTRLPREALGNWLDERERLWGRLESAAFECLPLDDECYDPFHTGEVNRALLPQGLVYSGGYGRYAKPHFFLGRLLKKEERRGFEVLVASDEYARDLASPPALLHDKTILIRRESLRRMLWERYEEWSWKRLDGPMARALAHYDFNGDADGALQQMTDHEIEAAILHELGEGLAGECLGSAWHDMLLALAGTRAELQARAVRDHLADCLCTLPALAEADDPASVHFYFANLSGMRQEIFPALAAAYRHWLDGGTGKALRALAADGCEHWGRVAMAMLALFREHDEEAAAPIEAWVQRSYL